MRTFQIWGSFVKGDKERLTTVSMFQKDQLMGDGTKMLDFEQRFAEEDGEKLVLLREFDVPHRGILDEDEEDEQAFEFARAVYNAYLDGWWHITQEDPHGHGKNE